MAKSKTKKNWVFAVGRRRAASARVRLMKGPGESLINNQPVEKYFPGVLAQSKWQAPFEVTQTQGKYHFTVRVVGGGKNGQLEATVHGLARALALTKPEKFRSPLKAAGLLRRDPRIRERRKIGMGGKARRKKQSPKR